MEFSTERDTLVENSLFMAYDEHLADRVNIYFEVKSCHFFTKKMFGGLCFMVNEKMCIVVLDNMIMARIDPQDEAKLQKIEGVKNMDFTGRLMKGYVNVGEVAIDSDEGLDYILDKALEFNPIARASKKRTKQA